MADEARFRDMYDAGRPPWDIDGPQRAFVDLERVGAIRGRVLDVGCGTGENALFLADRGHEVWGVDTVTGAIGQAREKARERALDATFRVWNVFDVKRMGMTFDSAIDSGLFHIFGKEDRARYADVLAHVVHPGGALHVLAMQKGRPPGLGPEGVSRVDIDAAFDADWTVSRVAESIYETRAPGPGEAAWIVTLIRRGS